MTASVTPLDLIAANISWSVNASGVVCSEGSGPVPRSQQTVEISAVFVPDLTVSR